LLDERLGDSPTDHPAAAWQHAMVGGQQFQRGPLRPGQAMREAALLMAAVVAAPALKVT
jgi:hypothetical protein